MQLAHEYGANQIWIVNVGGLKPSYLGPSESFSGAAPASKAEASRGSVRQR
ncbi:hypothetical protein SAMN00120144_3406 [Hymenobacter roseosalivarius DSM 11622]|uniref:Uncharacterized protein n=1 Tax=Hymenobacter roseosalivarius DSM 11622 TaxID=645990 RepID=A0A1W1UUA8_9BACT|nr:hypothetical protein SAMN00120144_3406 [Hymenobacter roseosalivarius DSM 11622]